MAKKNILLDLDQTLISAEASEDFDIDKHKERSKLFSWKDMDGYYIVFERPHLSEFLDYIFENFNVSVWTAASKDYALFIIEHIILAGKSGIINNTRYGIQRMGCFRLRLSVLLDLHRAAFLIMFIHIVGVAMVGADDHYAPCPFHRFFQSAQP